MLSVPFASFLERTNNNSNSCHLVLEGATGLYLRVLVPPPSGYQQPKIQACSSRQYQVTAI